MGKLKAFSDAEDVLLNYIKPHSELLFFMQRDAAIMERVLRTAVVYNVLAFACKIEMQKEMGRKYRLPF